MQSKNEELKIIFYRIKQTLAVADTTGFILCGLLITLPILFGHRDLFHFQALFIALLAWGGLFLWNTLHNRRQPVHVNYVDLLVGLYLIWGIVNLAWIKSGGTDPLWIGEWGTLLLCYGIARTISNRTIPLIFYGILLSGLCQAVIGVLQLRHVIPSNHNLFQITGSFINPGPYGGYLAICIVICTGVWIRARRCKRNILQLASAGVMSCVGVMLILSDSRAAWLAATIGMLYISAKNTPPHLRQRIITRLSRHKIILILTVCLLLGGLYTYKKGSADARLLTWRASYKLFTDAPLVGLGVNTFGIHYMDAQAAYFRDHPESRFLDMASNKHRAFNEFIHIACEQGAIGLLLFVGLTVVVFRKGHRNQPQYLIRAAWITLLVFSFFTYTADIYPLKLFYALLLGLIRTRSLHSFKRIPKSYSTAAVSSLIITAVVLQSRYKQAFDHLERYKADPTQEHLQPIQEHLSIVQYNPEFMWTYCQHLYLNQCYKTCVELFPHYHKNIQKTSETLCNLGNAYLQTGQTDQAETCFKQALQMIPSRLLPRYGLFNLYQSQGNHTLATQMAHQIINTPAEIVNSMTLRIRAEARKYMAATDSILPHE